MSPLCKAPQRACGQAGLQVKGGYSRQQDALRPCGPSISPQLAACRFRLSAEAPGASLDAIFFHLPSQPTAPNAVLLSPVAAGKTQEMLVAGIRHSLHLHVFILRTYKLIFSENKKQKFHSVTSRWTQPAHPVPTATKKIPWVRDAQSAQHPLAQGPCTALNKALNWFYNPKGQTAVKMTESKVHNPHSARSPGVT